MLAHQRDDDKDAKNAVNYAGNGGKQVDEEFQSVGNRSGASSARKIAAPMPSGTARNSATAAGDERPINKRQRAELSKTGSQTRVTKKVEAKLVARQHRTYHSSNTRRTVIRTTEAANKKVISRAISSPSRRRLKKEREPATGPALGTIVLVADILSITKTTGRCRVPLTPLRRLPWEALRRPGPPYRSAHRPASILRSL